MLKEILATYIAPICSWTEAHSASDINNSERCLNVGDKWVYFGPF